MSQLISAIGSIFANPFGQYMVNRQAENAYQDVFNQVRNANIQTGNQIAGLYGLGPLPQTSMLPAGMYSGYNVPQFGGLGFNPFAGTQGFGGGRPSGTYGPQGGGSFGPYSPVAPLTPESQARINQGVPPGHPSIQNNPAQQAQTQQFIQQPYPTGGLLGSLTSGSQQLAAAGVGANAYFNPQAAAAQYSAATRPLFHGYGQLQQQGTAQGAGINQFAQQRANQGAAQYGGLQKAYQQRGNQALGILAGSGAQERQDINRQFNEAQNRYQQDLFNRGFASSSVGAPGVGALERERSGALGGLNERLLQQRLGTFLGTTGESLAAAERGIGFGAGLTGDVLNTRIGQQQFGADLGLSTLGALSGLATGGLGYQTNLAQQGLNNLYQFGQIPLQYQQQAGQMAANFLGGIQQPYPQHPGFLQYQPTL